MEEFDDLLQRIKNTTTRPNALYEYSMKIDATTKEPFGIPYVLALEKGMAILCRGLVCESEINRTHAAKILVCYIENSALQESQIKGMITVLRDRSPTSAESSEEVREYLIRILMLIINQFGEAIKAFNNDLYSIFDNFLGDQCPQNLENTCDCLTLYASILKENTSKKSAGLVSPLARLSKTGKFKIRRASIAALGK